MGEEQRTSRALSRRTEVFVAACATAITAVALVALPWWLGYVANGSSDAARLRLDSIRTAFAFAAGMGGGVALWLAIRRQRSTELDLLHKERASVDASHDAAERRITEQYVQASEQLGSDRTAVRLAGVYAFERLAQDSPSLRQVVVDLLCAYLRMATKAGPATLYRTKNSSGYRTIRLQRPISSLADQGSSKTAQAAPGPDHEVATAIRDVITKHTRWYIVPVVGEPDPDTHPGPEFWRDISVNLSGALLASWDLAGCRFQSGSFDGAVFTGESRFSYLMCARDASFDGCTFDCMVSFYKAEFNGDLSISDAQFNQEFRFEGAECDDLVDFSRTKFCWTAWFDDSRFAHAYFDETEFDWDIWVNNAHFVNTVDFSKAKFGGSARFEGTVFDGYYYDGDLGCLRAAIANNPNARISLP